MRRDLFPANAQVAIDEEESTERIQHGIESRQQLNGNHRQRLPGTAEAVCWGWTMSRLPPVEISSDMPDGGTPGPQESYEQCYQREQRREREQLVQRDATG